jgi:hypothetical protein
MADEAGGKDVAGRRDVSAADVVTGVVTGAALAADARVMTMANFYEAISLVCGNFLSKMIWLLGFGGENWSDGMSSGIIRIMAKIPGLQYFFANWKDFFEKALLPIGNWAARTSTRLFGLPSVMLYLGSGVFDTVVKAAGTVGGNATGWAVSIGTSGFQDLAEEASYQAAGMNLSIEMWDLMRKMPVVGMFLPGGGSLSESLSQLTTLSGLMELTVKGELMCAAFDMVSQMMYCFFRPVFSFVGSRLPSVVHSKTESINRHLEQWGGAHRVCVRALSVSRSFLVPLAGAKLLVELTMDLFVVGNFYQRMYSHTKGMSLLPLQIELGTTYSRHALMTTYCLKSSFQRKLLSQARKNQVVKVSEVENVKPPRSEQKRKSPYVFQIETNNTITFQQIVHKIDRE